MTGYEIKDTDNSRPSHDSSEAVGHRVVVKIKRGDGSNPRNDTNMFQSQEQKDGPDKIKELSREKQRSQRCSGGETLGRESYTECPMNIRVLASSA